MALEKLVNTRVRFCVSSSISNFEAKIRKKFENEERFKWFTKDPVVFFGLYHPLDYLKFLSVRGLRAVFWAGGDAVNLLKHPHWARLIGGRSARHICETPPEQETLYKSGIWAEVRPVFFGDPNDFPVSFFPSNRPQVFLNSHPGREAEYGVDVVERIAPSVPDVTFHVYGGGQRVSPPNVVHHGMVSEEKFNEDIKNYHCGLRLNHIDGFSEVTAKSILMGQYPITRIPAPNIDSFSTEEELINLLKRLKYKKEPNYFARQFWHDFLCRKEL